MMGRRVALLLTGLLPLMAEYDIPEDKREGDELPFNSAEPIHDDSLHMLPALPINIVFSAGSDILMNHNVVATELKHFDSLNISSHPITEGNLLTSDGVEESLDGATEEHLHDQEKEKTETTFNEASALEGTATIEEHVGASMQDVPLQESTDSTEKGKGTVSQKNLKSSESETNVEETDDGPIERVVVDYASKSAGALILEKSSSMKGTSNLLNADKDKYAIAPCDDKKFVVIGLSEDILVKQVKLANYERYSSHVQTFQISGSQTMGDWVDLGTYEAHAGNGEQSFDLIQPSWARYLKFRFLSHFGMEHYCTISQIKVHGSTMLQGFREQWHDDDENGSDSTTGEVQVTPDSSQSSTDSTKSDTVPTNIDTAKEETELHQDPRNSIDATIVEETQVGADDQSETSDKIIVDESILKVDMVDVNSDTIPVVDEDLRRRLVTAILDAPPESKPTAISSASIDRLAKSLAESDAPIVLPQLDTNTITENIIALRAVNVAVKAFVAEASGAIINAAKEAPDAMDKLHKKIKTTIEAVLDKEPSNVSEIASIGSKPGKEPTNHALGDVNVASDSTIAFDEAIEMSHVIVEATPPPNFAEVDTTQDENGIEGKKEPPLIPTEKGATDEMLIGSTHSSDLNAGEVSSKQKGYKLHEPSGYEIPQSITDALRRFPNAKCLQNLNYPDLLASKANAKAAVANGQQNGANSRMEPIFKTLTDEIKLLQLSQSIQDLFSKDLISCYQSIILDMANEFDRLQVEQEARLSKVESEMSKMKSNGLWAMLTTVVSLPVLMTSFVAQLSIVGLVLSLLLQRVSNFLVQGYQNALLILNDEQTKIFARRVLSKEPEAVLIIAGSAVVLALFLTVMFKIFKPGKRPRKISRRHPLADKVTVTPRRNMRGKASRDAANCDSAKILEEPYAATPKLFAETKTRRCLGKYDSSAFRVKLAA